MNQKTECSVISHDPLIHEAKAILSGESAKLISKEHAQALLNFHDEAITYFHMMTIALRKSATLHFHDGGDNKHIKATLLLREITLELAGVIKLAEKK